ncbi:MAG: hypothetical protein NT090_13905, partial [Acidobacteria bacterium]|nr:hypothetical protein [Acidobacteriota bacterium]
GPGLSPAGEDRGRWKEQYSMRPILVVAALIAGTMAPPAPAAPKDQDLKAALEKQITSHYVLTKLSADRAGIAAPGTVLLVQKTGLMGSPVTALVPYQNSYKDGRVSHSFSNAILQNKETVVTFSLRDGFYLQRVDVKDNGVVFHLISANAHGGLLYAANLVFPFAKGYLASTDLGRIQPIVEEIFEVEGGNIPVLQPTTPASPAPMPEPQPSPAAPVTIGLGQTCDQVVAAVGQPEKLVKLGEREMYYYKDMKVTFLNGKVTDVQ